MTIEEQVKEWLDNNYHSSPCEEITTTDLEEMLTNCIKDLTPAIQAENEYSARDDKDVIERGKKIQEYIMINDNYREFDFYDGLYKLFKD